jgi:hypothetical protein
MIQIEPEQFLDPHWRHYRKEWNDDHGVWKDRPRHDDSSHGGRLPHHRLFRPRTAAAIQAC